MGIWEETLTRESYEKIIEEIRELHERAVDENMNTKDYYVAIGHLVTEEIFHLDGEDFQI